MTFNKENAFAILASCGLITAALSCDYGFNKYSPSTESPTPTPTTPATAGTFVISTASATIESPETLELSSGVLRLKKVGTEDWGCNQTGVSSSFTGVNAISNQVDSNVVNLASLFTPPSYLKVNELKLFLRRTGNPTATIAYQLFSTNGTVPVTPIISTPTISIVPDISSTPAWITFSLASSVELTKNSIYAIQNKNVSGNWDGTSQRYNWISANLNDDCTYFSQAIISSDNGANWSPTALRSYFLLNVDKYATSGTSSWTIEGLGGTWDMSTFSMGENLNGLTTGTVVYYIGTGESGASPNYTSNNLTLTQVQNLNDLTGTFLYVRAIFNISSQGYNNAVLSSGSILSY